MNAEMGLP
jgi:RNA-directed DNA polymerase